MTSRVYVAGVGMIPFVKPGANAPYHVMGAEATELALADAGIGYDMIQQAYVGYVYGDSTCGQRALYQVGMTGIPIVNVNNNCSTGSTALFLARQAIESGAVDCVLALGFEQMKPGALGAVFTDRPSAFDDFDAAADKLVDAPGVPLALRYFGGAGLSHMKKYGTPLSIVCQSPRQGEPACQEQSAGAVPQGSHRRRRDERPGDLARRDDAPDGLPADLRRRRGGPGFGEIRQQARPAQGRPHRRAGDDHRHRLAPSSAGDMMQVVGFDMAQRRGQQGLRGRRHRAGRSRRRRAARLLRAQRADHL